MAEEKEEERHGLSLLQLSSLRNALHQHLEDMNVCLSCGTNTLVSYLLARSLHEYDVGPDDMVPDILELMVEMYEDDEAMKPIVGH